MIDTHSHIYLEEFDDDREAVVERAKSAGVRHIVLPNVDWATYPRMVSLHEAHPRYTSMAMGLHPTSVGENFREELDRIRGELGARRFAAVGEVGVDLYWDATFREQQMEAFDAQLHWAEELSLPVIVHCREGLEAIASVFRNYAGTLPPCVFHSFGGTHEDADSIRSFGDFYFGINGVVTFKNSRLWEVLPRIGLDRILLETDCPYLTPVPFRGRRNESGYVRYVAERIASVLGVDMAEVSAVTDRNAERFFRLRLESES